MGAKARYALLILRRPVNPAGDPADLNGRSDGSPAGKRPYVIVQAMENGR